jgi:hypothetical protein
LAQMLNSDIGEFARLRRLFSDKPEAEKTLA